MNSEQAVLKAFEALGKNPSMRRATVYLSPKLTVKVTRRHKFSARAKYVSVVVSVGVSNYREALFIKACKKAGEPFPVKKVQLAPWPVPRKKKK